MTRRVTSVAALVSRVLEAKDVGRVVILFL